MNRTRLDRSPSMKIMERRWWFVFSRQSPSSAGRPVSIVSLSLSFPSGSLRGLEIGASIALDGVCLTVTSFDDANDTASFDVIPETLERTTLGELEVGALFDRDARATA